MSTNFNDPVLPGGTIGIVGGGQLGRMMALEAKKMGYRIAVLDPAVDCSCAQVADERVVGAYDDVDAMVRLATLSDVVTYEFENVNPESLAVIADRTRVPQGHLSLRITQHRAREKTYLEKIGVPVARYRLAFSMEDILEAVRAVGFPAVLKTTTGGYDGKGQWNLYCEQDVCNVSETLAAEQSCHPAPVEGAEGWDAPFIVEQFVPFEREISVLVARNPGGDVKVFPLAENVHQNHILHVSKVDGQDDTVVARTAFEIAKTIAQALDVVGVMGVEMFVTHDGAVLVNELAPRPHNSGHYSLDACVTSQFEQHIRAVCSLPLGQTSLLRPAVMVNILGQHIPRVLQHLPCWPEHFKLHLYGKGEARTNRKMGHVTVLADSIDGALADIAATGIWA